MCFISRVARHSSRFLALSVVLALIFSVGCVGTVIGKLEGDPLNPNAHRAQIVAVDAIVFDDGALSEAAREELAKTLLGLGEIASADKSNTLAVRLAQDLRTLAAMAARTKIGSPMLDSPLRQQWRRIRGSLFDDAAWFRHSSADPIEPAVPGPPPPSPLRPANAEERAGLDDVLSSLDDLIDRATRDLPNGYASEPHRQFVIEAERELSADEARLGPKPPMYGIDVFYQRAHRYAAEAVKVLKVLIGLGTGAPTSSREFLIRKAEEHVRKARAEVAEMR